MSQAAPSPPSPAAHHPLLRRRAAALDAEVHLTAGHDLGSVPFETHAAWRPKGRETSRGE